jgi:RES domain
MGEFKSWDAYGLFSRETARQRRFVRTRESDQFLGAVAVTCKDRLRSVAVGHIFWRAQLGHDTRWDEGQQADEDVALGTERMKPLIDRATEGRANPKGIPCLYLSTTENAAMSEVRPWIGAYVSVGQFKTVRALTIVDCSLLHDQYFNLAFLRRTFGEPVPPDKVDEIVWAAIDQAFARPTTKADDTAEYAATQILAELFKSEGYDGAAYKSAFGDDGYSVALFDLGSAQQVNGTLHETKSVEFEFRQSGNSYYVSSKRNDP